MSLAGNAPSLSCHPAATTAMVLKAPMSDLPTILIADDDALLRELLEHKLAIWGYRVLSAPDGEAAYELIREQRPSMALLDVMMPRLDGFALLRKMNQDGALAHTRVIMITGRTLEADVVNAFRWGVEDYVKKPFSLSELQSRIARIVSPPERA
ncbi:response regulator transcription factor [Paraburkholderia sacchari]|uniref:response regulator transcription factor n=1 Tax=Paraburkholderia sacchari TaxID=159450 RepID=UPI001BCDB935|nr:response regulator [Paraburkholderia sacchari]